MAHTQVFNISLSNLQTMFEKMQTQAGWDMNGKMYWGYYFLDSNLKKLETFALRLRELDYQIVEIRKIEGELFLLHAEKHMVHSAESLFDQCHQLATLANESNIEIFDGWDVEQTQMNKGLVE